MLKAHKELTIGNVTFTASHSPICCTHCTLHTHYPFIHHPPRPSPHHTPAPRSFNLKPHRARKSRATPSGLEPGPAARKPALTLVYPARAALLAALEHGLAARVAVRDVREGGGDLARHLHLLLPGGVLARREERRVHEQRLCRDGGSAWE